MIVLAIHVGLESMLNQPAAAAMSYADLAVVAAWDV